MGVNVLLILIGLLNLSRGDTDNCNNARSLCLGQTNCVECIRAHPCCHWCYQEAYNETRCDLRDHLSSCPPNQIMENRKTDVKIISDEPFSDVQSTNIFDVVQFKPQQVSIALRQDEPVNFTVRYQPAKNFPLDLYYLMDLTLSMKRDLNTMTQLGINLTRTLSTLTKINKIAFGSYVDKTAMPFYLTDPENFQNPCKMVGEGEQCKTGYLFKHRLNFTSDIEQFMQQMNLSRVSANVDNLEGGFDALMQILVCNQTLGWDKYSRKIIVLATESMMHLAGDGVLAGATERASKSCQIDPAGNYVNSLKYDYPSLEEIHSELRRAKTNVIVASKQNSFKYYQHVSRLIPEATFVGVLENDSTNILRLVRDGYYDFIKRVKMSIDTTHVDGLEVEFFADCYGSGNYKKTDSCYNGEEGKAIDFRVQLLLKKHQDKYYETLYVEERNIREKVQINIQYVGNKCNCTTTGQLPKSCNHGEYMCGTCQCEDGWSGPDCNRTCNVDREACRYKGTDGTSISCFGNGNCICGKCDCNFPFSGTYCNYTCPYDSKTRVVCGGQGTCFQGTCLCNDQYVGEDCTCPLSTQECVIPGTLTVCNAHGTCACGTCQCDAGYEGRLCETCSGCEGLCNVYLPCVVRHLENETENCLLEDTTVNTKRVYELGEDIKKTCYYRDEKQCETTYSYTVVGKNSVNIEIQGPNCGPVIGGWGIVGSIFAAIILGGLLALVAWKLFVSRKDRIEYEKFVREQDLSRHNEDNPIYRSPIVKYDNPMKMVELQHKYD